MGKASTATVEPREVFSWGSTTTDTSLRMNGHVFVHPPAALAAGRALSRLRQRGRPCDAQAGGSALPLQGMPGALLAAHRHAAGRFAAASMSGPTTSMLLCSD